MTEPYLSPEEAAAMPDEVRKSAVDLLRRTADCIEHDGLITIQIVDALDALAAAVLDVEEGIET